ncbi:uncharacterized protein LAJ45_03726 [Morchella importuna]|uniref:uncharacterized protein n=1 Tax=Morchella importuna TaxID=1174673 RepID=UPI001E8E955E|nr:uncharacterized protein LAJ45_03726 [Morchella importuna]KAH8152299.1 hypothetical protein LAJ45_03726 [Morchella importuna]
MESSPLSKQMLMSADTDKISLLHSTARYASPVVTTDSPCYKHGSSGCGTDTAPSGGNISLLGPFINRRIRKKLCIKRLTSWGWRAFSSSCFSSSGSLLPLAHTRKYIGYTPILSPTRTVSTKSQTSTYRPYNAIALDPPKSPSTSHHIPPSSCSRTYYGTSLGLESIAQSPLVNYADDNMGADE